MVMMGKRVTRTRKCAYILFATGLLIFWIWYLHAPAQPHQDTILEITNYNLNIDLMHLIKNLTRKPNESESTASRYVVLSSKCKIPNLNPYSPDILPYVAHKNYIRCRDKELLTYTTKQDNVATLHVDEGLVNQYSNSGIYCCYSSITRGGISENSILDSIKRLIMQSSDTPDTIIDTSPCVPFKNNVTLTEDTVLVTCKNDQEEIYRNVHASITINPKTQEKIQKFKPSRKNHLSVLFVGIDSISRSNMVRSLPLTHSFLQHNDWVEFKGYNKVGDNTFPNLMAILTGRNDTEVFDVCDPRVLGSLDKCNILWYDYRKLGFVTAYAEDEMEMGTFNLLKKGFKDPPTDYYFTPYVLASEKHLKMVEVDEVHYCSGPEVAGERIFNLARDFSSTFKNVPNFGFFWMNSYSHGEINSVSRMDEKVVGFLQDINRTGILENSLVVFISDHGFRMGNVTFTHTGWLEGRLPFFYVSVPKWFKEAHPKEYKNLVANTERLTTPYDLHMTLQDVLGMSGTNYTVKKSSACPKCKSLFEEVEKERSCSEAGIEPHWCTCSEYLTIPSTLLIVTQIAEFILREIRKAQVGSGGNYEHCLDFKLHQIISASISDPNATTHKNLTYFLVTFQTEPQAVFQGTVSIDMNVNKPVFKIEGSISRLDVYHEHSWCVNESTLKKYCYCQSLTRYLLGSIESFVRRIFNVF